MAKEWYLASVLDWETTACFLALQEIRQSSRKSENAEVEHWSSRLSNQSESQKALSLREPLG